MSVSHCRADQIFSPVIASRRLRTFNFRKCDVKVAIGAGVNGRTDREPPCYAGVGRNCVASLIMSEAVFAALNNDFELRWE